VVAGKQDWRDGPFYAALGREDLRSGVVGIFNVALAAVRLFDDGGFLADDAGHEARDGIKHDHGRKFAAGQDVVADGDFLVHQMVGDALVDAFVTAADEHQPVVLGEAGADGVGEASAAGESRMT